MAKTRGSKRTTQAAQNAGSGGFIGEIRWKKDGEKKYIQIITPREEWWEVDMYFGKVGQWPSGSDHYEWFVQPDEGRDPIAEKWDIKPKLRTLAVAVELEPVFQEGRAGTTKKVDHYEVATDDEYGDPLVGIINQSHLFYSYLTTYEEDFGPVENQVFHVVRKGTGTNTSYMFTPVGDAIELDDEVLDAIDLDQWVVDHESDEHYQTIDDLSDDYIFDYYQQVANKKDGGRGGRAASSKRSSSRSRAAESDDDGDEENEDKGPARRSSGRASTNSRKARFDRVREKVDAQRASDVDDDGDEE